MQSYGETRLRFKDDDSLREEFIFENPSVSIELPPPPLDRVPSKSCLKKSSIIPSNAELLTKIRHVPQTGQCTSPDLHISYNMQPHQMRLEAQIQTLPAQAQAENVIQQENITGPMQSNTAFLKERYIPLQNINVINGQQARENSRGPNLIELASMKSISKQLSPNDRIELSDEDLPIIQSGTIETPRENPDIRHLHLRSVSGRSDLVTDQNNNREGEDSSIRVPINDRQTVSNNNDDLKKQIESESIWIRNFNEYSMEPDFTDYWENTSYRRRIRRSTYIKEIMELNSRPSKNKEVEKQEVATFTVVELCRDGSYSYARCYTIANVKVSILIVPCARFPADKPVLLGSIWRSTLELIRLNLGARKEITVARVKDKGLLEQAGFLEKKIKTRTIKFGTPEANTSFYSEMIQIYVPLEHTSGKDIKENFYCPFGDVKYNTKVLPPIPPGIAVVEGNGWIEPKPGDYGILKSSKQVGWLLVEPFIQYKMHDKHFGEEYKLSPAEQAARKKDIEIKTKKIVNDMVRKRAEGYTMYPRDNKRNPKPKCPAHTKDGAFGKRERRDFCRKLIKNIARRGTNANVFHSISEVLDLVVKGENRGTRLGLLGDIVIGYLRKEDLRAELKKNEPENLEDLRQIAKWTVDYTKEGRNALGPDLYDFIFPMEEDSYIVMDEWTNEEDEKHKEKKCIIIESEKCI